MRKNILAVFGLLSYCLAISASPLVLQDNLYRFNADPLENWQNPDDPRFLQIDLEKFFASDFNTKLRQELDELRQKYIEKFRLIYNQPEADYIDLQKEITRELMAFTAKQIVLAKPAELDDKDYAFVAFGSAGRLESGIVTDLEGALIFSDRLTNTAELSQKFGNSLARILNGLLGHPLYGVKGYRLDEQSNAPLHYAPFVNTDKTLGEILCQGVGPYLLAKNTSDKAFALKYYYPFEGSLVLSTTPKNLAKYAEAVLYNMPQIFQLSVNASTRKSSWYAWAKQFLLDNTYTDPKYLETEIKNSSCGQNLSSSTLTGLVNSLIDLNQTNELKVVSAFADIGRNHYFVAGNPDLYDEFVNERELILDGNNGQIRSIIAQRNLQEITSKWAQKKYGGEMFVAGKLPSSGVLDLKRHNYRLTEQFLTAMRVYFGLEEQNQADIINALRDRKIFGEDFAKALISAVNHLTKLRWLSQIKVGGQLPANMHFVDKSVYQSSRANIEKIHKNNEAAINNIADKNSIAYLKAKNSLIDSMEALEKIPKLEPLNDDSILSPSELAYFRHVLIPFQNELFKRIVSFFGSSSKKIPKNPEAFLDSFCPNSVNLTSYGIPAL